MLMPLYFVFNLSWVQLFFIHMSFIFLVLIFFSEGSSEIKGMVAVVTLLFWVVFVVEGMTLFWFFVFELTLIPSLFLLFSSGGQVEKVSAVFFMGVFTYAPSLLLIYPLFFYEWYSTGVISSEMGVLISLIFFSKIPVVGMHFWLPRAHVESPTSLSMLLAALLLKMGFFGLLMVIYHLNCDWILLVVLVTLLGTVMMTLVVVVTTDAKALVAYSSVAHMSLCVLGVVLDLSVVLMGASISSLAHSYISALMFYVVGEIYHMNGTRILPYMSGFSHISNSVVFMVSLNLLANGSVPPAFLFFGELTVLSVSFNVLFFLFVVVSVYFIFSLYYSVSLMVVFMKSGGNMSLVPLVLLSTSLPYVFIVLLMAAPMFIY